MPDTLILSRKGSARGLVPGDGIGSRVSEGWILALPRGFRFPVSHEDVFPAGALVVGEVEIAAERQSQEDRQRGREARQRVDEGSRLPVWRVVVSDPAPARRAEASVTVEILAEERPVLPDPVPELASMGVRPVEFVGLKAQPRLGGQGDYRHLTWAYTADGVRAPQAGSGAASSAKPAKSAGSGSGEGSSAGGR